MCIAVEANGVVVARGCGLIWCQRCTVPRCNWTGNYSLRDTVHRSLSGAVVVWLKTHKTYEKQNMHTAYLRDLCSQEFLEHFNGVLYSTYVRQGSMSNFGNIDQNVNKFLTFFIARPIRSENGIPYKFQQLLFVYHFI